MRRYEQDKVSFMADAILQRIEQNQSRILETLARLEDRLNGLETKADSLTRMGDHHEEEELGIDYQEWRSALVCGSQTLETIFKRGRVSGLRDEISMQHRVPFRVRGRSLQIQKGGTWLSITNEDMEDVRGLWCKAVVRALCTWQSEKGGELTKDGKSSEAYSKNVVKVLGRSGTQQDSLDAFRKAIRQGLQGLSMRSDKMLA